MQSEMVGTLLQESHRVAYGWEEELSDAAAITPFHKLYKREHRQDVTHDFSRDMCIGLIWSPPVMANGIVSSQTIQHHSPIVDSVSIAVTAFPIGASGLVEVPDLQSILGVNQSSYSFGVENVSRRDTAGTLQHHTSTVAGFISPKDKEIYFQLQQYIVGIEGTTPTLSTIRMAIHFVEQAIGWSYKTEIDFDDDDGSLLFDLRLLNGLLLMAELYPSGTLYVGVHDDRGEGYSKLVKWLENPSEEQITEIFHEAK